MLEICKVSDCFFVVFESKQNFEFCGVLALMQSVYWDLILGKTIVCFLTYIFKSCKLSDRKVVPIFSMWRFKTWPNFTLYAILWHLRSWKKVSKQYNLLPGGGYYELRLGQISLPIFILSWSNRGRPWVDIMRQIVTASTELHTRDLNIKRRWNSSQIDSSN